MRLTLALFALLPLAAIADTQYVTDNLRLGLYEAEDTSGRAFRMLESGQAMEVLSRDQRYANVRLPDNTEGWVKAAYLVTEKPAKLIVAETAAERDGLIAELAETKKAFAAPAATITSLEAQLSELDGQLGEANSLVSQLQEENASVEALKQQYKGSLPLTWVGGALLVCLLGGFLLGLWWVDFRSRQRHGGFRVY